MRYVAFDAPLSAVSTSSSHFARSGSSSIRVRLNPNPAPVRPKEPAVLRHAQEALDIVTRAVSHSDPEAAVRKSLAETQAAQQSRFAALPLSAREDDWIQMRHGEFLRLNEALHSAALDVLRSLAAIHSPMPPVQ